MQDYFKMYDLEAGSEAQHPTESAPGEPSLKRPTRRPAVRGNGATSNADPAPRRDDDNNDEAKASRLMCDYLPMVREYLGESPVENTSEDDTDDGFVYDVYVQCVDDDVDGEGDDPTRPDGFLAGDSSAVFVGGMDTALFFDAMDGLMDDGVDDDVDSQDSNREDAPDADYPEDESDVSWDEEEDDGYGRRRGAGVDSTGTPGTGRTSTGWTDSTSTVDTAGHESRSMGTSRTTQITMMSGAKNTTEVDVASGSDNFSTDPDFQPTVSIHT